MTGVICHRVCGKSPPFLCHASTRGLRCLKAEVGNDLDYGSMKNRVSILALASLLLLAVVGCSGGVDGGVTASSPESPSDGALLAVTPLKDLPSEYDWEQAVTDGCVYIGHIESENENQDLVNAFYINVAATKEAFMRVFRFTTEGDAIITDYHFNGSVFTVDQDSTRDKYSSPTDRIITTRTFTYLVPDPNDEAGHLLSNEKVIQKDNEDLAWIPSATT